MRGADGSRSLKRITALVAVCALLAVVASVLADTGRRASAAANGAAATPQMGWSSWSFIRQNPTEVGIKAQAKAMHDLGLVGHGYSYANIDDFYYLNPSTTVDAYGRWVVDPARFPDGMAAMGSYVHGLGEKFGLYLTPGIPVAAYDQNTPIEGTTFHARDIVSDTSKYETNYNNNFGGKVMYYIDYAKNPAAAQAFLNSWANLLASWGADYLKLDGVGDWDISDVQHWSQALGQASRKIHFELSNSLDIANAPIWRQYANGWRIDGDVECYCSTLTNWNNVAQRFNDLPPWAGYAGAGGWNDPDSVEVGNGSKTGLTPDERQTQLTLWAVSAAPLVLGTDLTSMDAGDLSLLSNDEVIAVDQRGHVARPVDRISHQQVWSAPNGDGSYTVALFNLDGGPATVTANWADIGFGGSASVRDLWSHTDLGTFNGGFGATLNAHASRLLRVVPASGFHYTAMYYRLVNGNSGNYLDVSGASTADGAGIVQKTAGNGTDQQWQLVPDGSGAYLIVNRNSGKLLNIPGPSPTPGTQLIQYHDDGNANSRWRLTPTGSGSYTIASQLDAQNVDVSAASTADGAAVVQSAPAGTASQQWRLVPVVDPGTPYKLVDANSGGRMDVNNDSTADGATILQWQDNGQADQRWTFGSAAGGAYTIVNVNSGKLLNIPGPTTAQGTQLIQYYDDGNANSRWRLVDAGPGQVQIVSVYDGQLVDVWNNSLSNGGAVIQWPANGGANQRWTLLPG